MKNIIIGTAAFGLPYGLSNNNFPVELDKIKSIINTADEQKLLEYDTAPSYGKSETLLGKYTQKEILISTKTHQINKEKISSEDIKIISNTFKKSMKSTNRNIFENLYIHSPSDLINQGGEYVYEWLENLKYNKHINKIGVSVFHIKDLETILKKYKIDVVQIPLNLFDQRFLKSGMISNLRSLNIEINIRSIYLQGLLLKPMNKIPKYFDEFKKYFDQVDDFISQMGLSRIQLCFLFVKQISEVNKIIIGFKNKNQISDLLSIDKMDINLPNLSYLASNEINLIYPTKWWSK